MVVMYFIFAIFMAAIISWIYGVIQKNRAKLFKHRLEIIKKYQFSTNLIDTFYKVYPQLNDQAVVQVITQLRNYFIIVLTCTL